MRGVIAVGKAISQAAARQRSWLQATALRSLPPTIADAPTSQAEGIGAVQLPQILGGLGRRGLAMGQHPLYELDKIQRTAEGHIDITEDEPGTGDMPHVTGRLPDLVEEEFRVTREEEEVEKGRQGAIQDLPEFFTSDTIPSSASSFAASSASAAADLHTGAPSDSTYVPPSPDYSHGAIPVVTDPGTGLASGSVAVADGARRAERGQAVIRGPGAETEVGLSSKGGPEQPEER
ncbi:hypothetical protein VOLCADRAFT_116559 [Volvox carteri f. nagariensis]|uniref:Uncharacterized protein n=1 Tax=Volvox carteri f. nagariensis TaxID=3068 RepID=D8TNE4_VOLCA|nr:uncharacterized protein VOLCADRAFT_116559 [Volvox carteri f. nagariensis]EFJ50978.1 hypothetical protein VOLCADRAFT_116559 [Volvox carteri f. nagariensis]|eukprot:XP_002947990.1 hypothetical protein VOLCADRAFT_116559 [Volvox carteri f. nagariensis]